MFHLRTTCSTTIRLHQPRVNHAFYWARIYKDTSPVASSPRLYLTRFFTLSLKSFSMLHIPFWTIHISDCQIVLKSGHFFFYLEPICNGFCTRTTEERPPILQWAFFHDCVRDKPVAYPDAYKNLEERRPRICRILPSSLCPLHFFLAWAPRRQRSLQGLHITPSPSISSVRPISKRR